MEIHGGDVYTQDVRLDFSINVNPLGMPDEVREAATRGIECAEQYPDTQCRSLRTMLARAEQVSEDQIIFGNGAAELIYQIVQAVRPRQALLVTPSFAEYELALRAGGAKISYYPCTRENGFQIGEDFLTCITPETDILFLCNPNNPTGIGIPDGLLRKIASRCHRTNTILVVDECFNGLWPDGENRSVKSMLTRVPQLFILRAFTKLYAMPGLRLGYGLSNNTGLLRRMSSLGQPWNISVPAQLAGTAALKLEGFTERTRQEVARELQFLKEGLQTLGLTYWPSEANYLFFAGPDNLKELCLAEGILIRSCANYRGLAEGYFRVAVRTRKDNEELLRVLGKVLGADSSQKAE